MGTKKRRDNDTKITRCEPREVADGDIVRLKETGNITEIMCSATRSYGGYITKIDKDHYVDTRTGEYKEFTHNTSRASDLDNVAKSLAQGRDLLNTNITDVSCCRWITFTYAENMTDPKRLKVDFKQCIRALRSIYGNFEYITAAEPQARGAWHLHAVFIFPKKAPYMKNSDVAACWKQGFVTVKKLDDVDNVGAYLTAYLGDIDLDELKDIVLTPHIDEINGSTVKTVEVMDENGVKVSKRYIKGARLHFYPSGFHIFRWSTGIKKPEVTNCKYSTAKEKVSGATLTYCKALTLEDEATEYKNHIQYEYYNTLRKA